MPYLPLKLGLATRETLIRCQLLVYTTDSSLLYEGAELLLLLLVSQRIARSFLLEELSELPLESGAELKKYRGVCGWIFLLRGAR